MKKYWIAFFIILFASYFFISQSDWHLKRNINNKLPSKILSQIDSIKFIDQAGVFWILQPVNKSILHQPDEIIMEIRDPYPNVNGEIEYDPKNPNLKFLSRIENGASYEAILQPNGIFLLTGKLQGTYNYSHPEGLIGNTKHLFLDVIPHFINSNYSN